LTAVQALASFFVSSFGDSELRAWLQGVERYEPLLPHLPGGSASIADVASVSAGLLFRRGLVDEELLASLLQARPQRGDDILRLRGAIGLVDPARSSTCLDELRRASVEATDGSERLFRTLARTVLRAGEEAVEEDVQRILELHVSRLLCDYRSEPTIETALRALELQVAMGRVDRKLHRAWVQAWLAADARTWTSEQRALALAIAELQRSACRPPTLRAEAFAIYVALWRTGDVSPTALRWLGALACEILGQDGAGLAGHVWSLAYGMDRDCRELREDLRHKLDGDGHEYAAGLVERGLPLPLGFDPYPAPERPVESRFYARAVSAPDDG